MAFPVVQPVRDAPLFNVLVRHCQAKSVLDQRRDFPCVLLEGTLHGMYYRRHAKARVIPRDGHIVFETPFELPPQHLFTTHKLELGVESQWHSPFKGVGEDGKNKAHCHSCKDEKFRNVHF